MARHEQLSVTKLYTTVLTLPNGVKHYQGSAAPTTGTAKQGDIVWNTAPTAGGNTVGWICVAGGSPGTWKAFGSVAA